MQARFLFSEVGSGLRRNVSMAISVVLVTMVSMFLLGLGLLAQRQADTMKGYWYDRIQVSIYLCTTDSRQPNCENTAVTDAQKAAIQRQLEALPEVKAVFFESEQEAYDRFKEQFRNSPIAGNVQVGDIPQSLRVQLNDPTKYEVVTQQFEGAPGVATVQDQEKVLSKFFTIIKWITIFAVALAAPDGGLCGLADGDHDPTGGLHQAPRDRHHAAGRGVELDDPDAVPHRDDHRLRRGGAPRRRPAGGPDEVRLRGGGHPDRAEPGVHRRLRRLDPRPVDAARRHGDRGGHQPGHAAALPARLRRSAGAFAEDTATTFFAPCVHERV